MKRSEESKQNAIQGADRNLKEKTRELELVKQQLSTSRDGNTGLTKQNKVLEIKNAELAQVSALLPPGTCAGQRYWLHCLALAPTCLLPCSLQIVKWFFFPSLSQNSL